MLRLVLLICAFTFLAGDPIRNSNLRNGVYTVTSNDNITYSCSDNEAKMWSYDFHTCFMDRKYGDGGRDLNNIVDRILDHSKDCISNSTKGCKPDYGGFLIIMEKIIHEMKDYCFIYLEHIVHDRHKVKDLKCVERSLSLLTYEKCFKNVLGQHNSTEMLKREVEKAISCTNLYNKDCSTPAKTSLNRMVRNILAVEQPAKEDIKDDTPKPEPPKTWYDYIFQPFVSFWNTIRSFFGRIF